MKTILGIIGSPRKLGNCEIAVKAVSRAVHEPHILKLLRIADFDIRPCRGCYACLFRKGECVIPDDLPRIWEAVLGADALVVAAPTYFLGPNASLKHLLDRGLSLLPHIEGMWGKPAVGIGIAGIPEKEGYTRLGIESFLKLLMTEIKGCEIFYSALPGEISLEKDHEPRLSILANALFGPALNPKSSVCPVCGGDTFRFMEDGRIRCMLCSNPGTFDMKDGRLVFEIRPGGHEMFLSRESAVRHREWLKGMKDRFLKQKNQLKKISVEYLKDGTWIQPPEKNNKGHAS
ncbi:MAG: flavodoxin family protein [Deltaproteobacteria bacterium]|nr:flavodoxin family protein [Deltaproteobacteria bacterium]MBW2042410.1 flavodoxin family protein [Deltaproteobacteria bacterium]MBW2131053.1 flavodoxin family protein [Deltaproteobacteria bacterium]